MSANVLEYPWAFITQAWTSISMDIDNVHCKYPQISMGIHRAYACKFVDINEYSLIFTMFIVNVRKCPRISPRPSTMRIHGYPWTSMTDIRISAEYPYSCVHGGGLQTSAFLHIHGYPCMNFVSPQMSANIHEDEWASVDGENVLGFLVRSQMATSVHHAYPWISMDINQCSPCMSSRVCTHQ